VIMPGLLGYAVTDRSANGVFVNGIRVEGVARLGQGDRLRIADFEFVFEADAAQLEPDRDKTRTTAETPVPTKSRRAPVSSTAALASVTEPMPVFARPDAPRLLATLEVLNEGSQHGQRIRLEKPVVHVGRGSHSDIRFTEDSVSSTHATLLQRGPEWHVLDLGSRNGTYIDGARITEETVIDEVPATRKIAGTPGTKR
jgi:pSer/pThr/pTyr-binding forkhead associated (FHA) protein